jgi:hypothetical protein
LGQQLPQGHKGQGQGLSGFEAFGFVRHGLQILQVLGPSRDVWLLTRADAQGVMGTGRHCHQLDHGPMVQGQCVQGFVAQWILPGNEVRGRPARRAAGIEIGPRCRPPWGCFPLEIAGPYANIAARSSSDIARIRRKIAPRPLGSVQPFGCQAERIRRFMRRLCQSQMRRPDFEITWMS